VSNSGFLWTHSRRIFGFLTSRTVIKHTPYHEANVTRRYIQVSALAAWSEELRMVQLSATRRTCIAILWVSLVGFDAVSLCVASHRSGLRISSTRNGSVSFQLKQRLQRPYLATYSTVLPSPVRYYSSFIMRIFRSLNVNPLNRITETRNSFVRRFPFTHFSLTTSVPPTVSLYVINHS
jgi:hypothetical protein